jgi:hypothetical protein
MCKEVLCLIFCLLSLSYFLNPAVGDLEPAAAAEDGAVDSKEVNVNITDEEKEQRLALGKYIGFPYFLSSKQRWEITLI